MEDTSNSQKLGEFVAGAMETLEREFPDATLGNIMLVCALEKEYDDGETSTITRYICTDPRVYVQLGMIRTAQLAAEHNGG